MIKNMRVTAQDMPDFIHSKIKSGFSVNIYPIYEYWIDMGNKNIFKQLKKKNGKFN